MKCPKCGNDSDKVIDSRKARDGRAVRRRRECSECGYRFTTYEYIEEDQLLVVKKDGRREPFEINKLIAGIQIACRKRPISSKTIENTALSIKCELSEREVNEIDSDRIGEMVMKKLKEIDQVAYVRFASVYRQFKDVEEFHRALNKLFDEKLSDSLKD